jgi:hypothetical protein
VRRQVHWTRIVDDNARDRRIADQGATMTIGGRGELRGDVLPEQCEVGGVGAVGDGQRAAEVVAGLGKAHRRGRRVEGDVGEVEIFRLAEARNGACRIPESRASEKNRPFGE